MPSHPLTLPCPNGLVGGGARSPVAVAPGIFSSEVSEMLPVCVYVSMPLCVCVCVEGEMCCRPSGPPGLRCKSPGLLVLRATAQLDTYIGRKRERGARDQTEHILDISPPSICLAENYPQLSTPVSLRKSRLLWAQWCATPSVRTTETRPTHWKGLKRHICLGQATIVQGSSEG